MEFEQLYPYSGSEGRSSKTNTRGKSASRSSFGKTNKDKLRRFVEANPREPFWFKCTKGPGCAQHDWERKSPLHDLISNKVVASKEVHTFLKTRPNILNKFKWKKRQNCPVIVSCKLGPDCKVHDWVHRSPLRPICNCPDRPYCKKHDWAKYGIVGGGKCGPFDKTPTPTIQEFKP